MCKRREARAWACFLNDDARRMSALRDTSPAAYARHVYPQEIYPQEMSSRKQATNVWNLPPPLIRLSTNHRPHSHLARAHTLSAASVLSSNPPPMCCPKKHERASCGTRSASSMADWTCASVPS
eukprot:scaffold218368_cov27-Tisochrysis_lutea.AAC.2